MVVEYGGGVDHGDATRHAIDALLPFIHGDGRGQIGTLVGFQGFIDHGTLVHDVDDLRFRNGLVSQHLQPGEEGQVDVQEDEVRVFPPYGADAILHVVVGTHQLEPGLMWLRYRSLEKPPRGIVLFNDDDGMQFGTHKRQELGP